MQYSCRVSVELYVWNEPHQRCYLSRRQFLPSEKLVCNLPGPLYLFLYFIVEIVQSNTHEKEKPLSYLAHNLLPQRSISNTLNTEKDKQPFLTNHKADRTFAKSRIILWTEWVVINSSSRSQKTVNYKQCCGPNFKAGRPTKCSEGRGLHEPNRAQRNGINLFCTDQFDQVPKSRKFHSCRHNRITCSATAAVTVVSGSVGYSNVGDRILQYSARQLQNSDSFLIQRKLWCSEFQFCLQTADKINNCQFSNFVFSKEHFPTRKSDKPKFTDDWPLSNCLPLVPSPTMPLADIVTTTTTTTTTFSYKYCFRFCSFLLCNLDSWWISCESIKSFPFGHCDQSISVYSSGKNIDLPLANSDTISSPAGRKI